VRAVRVPRWTIAAAAAFLLLAVLPGRAWAFGPATHVYLGSQLLELLYLLPDWLGTLIKAYPQSFLYGSMAADISFAKKYVPAGRHCHFWHVGEEILDTADNDRLRAVAFGYLSHLAADTIAHNYFVPRQLLLTSSSKALGHGYWEHRMDAHLGEAWAASAREIVMEYDHAEADDLFDRVLSKTIFSFGTNRKIFRGMIRVQDNERWKAVFDRVRQSSRWDLTDQTVEAYLARAFDYVVDYLTRRRDSLPATLDPTGEFNLHLAKKVRKLALHEDVSTKPTVLLELADDFFPLPNRSLGYWEQIQRQAR
jgi:hypothetical protein